jgi:thymidylate synthase (FAD)
MLKHALRSAIIASMSLQLPNYQIDKKAEGELVDIMGGSARWEIKVHDHGLVARPMDAAALPAGKTERILRSCRQRGFVCHVRTKQINEDRGLIRSARHRHTTPFEMVEFKFHHVMPIFVAHDSGYGIRR